jgi:hypothetical protein
MAKAKEHKRSCPTAAQLAAKAKEQSTSYHVGLKDTRNGIAIIFPPERSGYVHIGHAKVACLNEFIEEGRKSGGAQGSRGGSVTASCSMRHSRIPSPLVEFAWMLDHTA